MIQDYISFNATKYLKDYYYHKDSLNALEAKYEALDGMRAIDLSGDRVQSTPQHDALEKIAVQRVLLSEKIADHKDHIKTVETALQRLTPEERNIIDIFFNPKNNGNYYDHGFSKATAYRLRHTALEHITLHIVGAHNIK